MAGFINPIGGLEDIADMFADAQKRDESFTADPVLCGIFAEELQAAADFAQRLFGLAEAAGLLERVAVPSEAQPRTPVERQRLARLAAPLDPEGRVVAFPVTAARPAAAFEGGSAA